MKTWIHPRTLFPRVPSRLLWLLAPAFVWTSAFSVGPAAAQDARVDELERKVDALTREIERLQLGEAADTTVLASAAGLGPAASKVYGSRKGVAIGGYGEMLYEDFDRKREDDAPSGARDRLDFLRNVIYLGYRFDDRLLFDSEIEIEHAGVQDEAEVEGQADPGTGEVEGEAELSGEVSLEFAFLEWRARPAFGLRAGLLLIPLGWINEIHEPPATIGARRPEVEQRIVPATWRGNGAGVVGEWAHGLAYRAYVTEGLDASGFTAAGIRDGRQSGSRSLLTKPAFSARLDYSGLRGFTVGASLFTGDAWQDGQPASAKVSPRVVLGDVHGRLEWRGLLARALYAQGSLDDAGALSDALGLTGAERLGERFFGGYAEAAYDLLQRFSPGSRWALSPYLRWETYDTQEEVPGGSEDPSLEVSVTTVGAELRPHPNVVLKADRQWRTNQADTGVGQWNAAAGYSF